MAGLRGEWFPFFIRELDSDNPQLRRFAKRLGITRTNASGIYARIVHYVWRHEPEGKLDRIDAEDLEDAADWGGEAGAMFAAFRREFEDLYWDELWSDRVRFLKLHLERQQRKREVNQRRQAAFRSTQDGSRKGKTGSLNPKPPGVDSTSTDVTRLSRSIYTKTNRPTETQNDRKTDPPISPQRQQELAAVLGAVGGSFTKQPGNSNSTGNGHPAFAALQRCALGLGLLPADAAAFVAFVAQQLDARGVRSALIDDNLALLIYAVDLDGRRARSGGERIRDFTVYVAGCEFHARNRHLKKARELFALEFEKERGGGP